MGLLDNNIMRLLRGSNAVSSASYQLDTVQNIVTIPSNDNFGAILVNVTSLSSGASLVFVSTNNPIVLFKIYNATNGELLSNINQTGRFYIPMNGNTDLAIRNAVAIENGTATLSVRYVEDIPDSVVLIKPIQLVVTQSLALSTARQQIFNGINLTDFKYYFITYTVFNNNTSVVKSVTIEVQPYHQYIIGNKAGLNEIIVENQSAYSYQTEWLPVRGETYRVYVKETEYTEGDTIYMNIYGVR